MNTNAMMNVGPGKARRRLILALGRGKSGKTLWSRWLVETMCARGLSPVAADADTVTRGLSRHHDGALCLGSEPDALVAWWTTLTANREEIAGRPVVVDFSPDKGLIRSVNASVPDFGERHAALAIDVTKVFFFAPDVGAAVTFANAGADVTAATTLLVLNEGAVGDRKPDRFDAVLVHPAIRQAVEKGARVVRMPELHLDPNRAAEIASFTALAEGKSGKADAASFERHVARTWLGRMEEAFSPFSRDLALG
jgi:hypothetical protein